MLPKYIKWISRGGFLHKFVYTNFGRIKVSTCLTFQWCWGEDDFVGWIPKESQKRILLHTETWLEILSVMLVHFFYQHLENCCTEHYENAWFIWDVGDWMFMFVSRAIWPIITGVVTSDACLSQTSAVCLSGQHIGWFVSSFASSHFSLCLDMFIRVAIWYYCSVSSCRWIYVALMEILHMLVLKQVQHTNIFLWYLYYIKEPIWTMNDWTSWSCKSYIWFWDKV